MASDLLPEEKRKVKKPLLFLGIAGIVMAFAGLTSGYYVSRTALLTENKWFQFELPWQFTLATALIVLSSVSMFMGLRSIKRGNKSQMVNEIWVTLFLGIGFVFAQYFGWAEMIEKGLYFTGEGSSTSVSWVYVITLLHWLHVLSGIIVLIVTIYQARKGKYTSKDYLGLQLSAIYWHFLDALWIYLFLFLAFIR